MYIISVSFFISTCLNGKHDDIPWDWTTFFADTVSDTPKYGKSWMEVSQVILLNWRYLSLFGGVGGLFLLKLPTLAVSPASKLSSGVWNIILRIHQKCLRFPKPPYTEGLGLGLASDSGALWRCGGSEKAGERFFYTHVMRFARCKLAVILAIHGSQALVLCFTYEVPMLQVLVAKAFCCFTALKNFREKRWPKAGSGDLTVGELENCHF